MSYLSELGKDGKEGSEEGAHHTANRLSWSLCILHQSCHHFLSRHPAVQSELHAQIRNGGNVFGSQTVACCIGQGLDYCCLDSVRVALESSETRLGDAGGLSCGGSQLNQRLKKLRGLLEERSGELHDCAYHWGNEGVSLHNCRSY